MPRQPAHDEKGSLPFFLLATPGLHLDVPGAGAVTGVSLDEQGNMWVAKSSVLFLVRRGFETAPEIIRNTSPPSGLGGFAGLRAGDGNQLAWIDPSSGRIGTLQTYEN